MKEIESNPPCEVLTYRKNRISLEALEDKFFFLIDEKEDKFSIYFKDEKYGVFLSYDSKGKEDKVNKFLLPNSNSPIHIETNGNSGIVIFFPLYKLNNREELNKKKINTVYGEIISKLRVNFSEEKSKMIVEINAIICLVSISLIESEKERIIDKIVSFIRENITNDKLSLDYVAHNLYMSKRKLQYIFSSNKTTYKKTLNEVKIDLLVYYINENPDVSIKYILSKCGFNSHSSASNAFKIAKGETLYQYKKKIRAS
ncbi:helix-turn-helix domain-containing protein [Aliivibrio fischeri]|uniref:helix-turn-helix domain-containing protein n=1 Tax=Aliivibrio fischeri TaxID=668 RepID=UPI003735F141